MEHIYLSRRNLLTLLSKLDRKKNGDETECTIIKPKGKFPFKQSMDECHVIAVEDDIYYMALGRKAGIVHPLDGGEYNGH